VDSLNFKLCEQQGTVVGALNPVDESLVDVWEKPKFVYVAFAEVVLRSSALPHSKEGYLAWQLRREDETKG
jgi:hypothetical protein